ncbi:lysylphosphatidylglycerol synthase domain-containing protein [Crocosphaera sp. UHCC 0190]|uniref:lysylphosphatidylglycerol synthase transmembrane domain-containing protein n=1 Tax=Crocosphaera sp. UHCC 0190 TaxID=3110246 RepID=UPI002B1EB2B1|nr:lysylphosphatidylglycerol synthase domain-containing protein [Crocosphaera sp. UHCC 0190]MEA5511911.1 lysylphosphatidylglycerol synthase domain-containing protein [Crocosphaera sp. UHCC 0190]
MSLIKAYVKWIIVGFTLFFIIITFKKHWQSVTEISLNYQGWLFLFLALIITLIAHIWSAWVWLWILKLFKQSFSNQWGLKVYLITNIYKYLPGNVGHFYGRISAISQQGGSVTVASLSVLLEPLLMAAAALLIALSSHSLGLIKTTNNLGILWLQGLALISVLIGIHPLILNRVIGFFQKLNSKKNLKNSSVYLDRYPGNILLGELGFVLLRGLGFILVFMAFMPVTMSQIPILLSAFSFAWLLGLIIPGAPGGMGVFEATIIALFQSSNLPISIVLSAIAIFRIISILAELIGAGLGYLFGNLSSRHY